MSVETLAIVLHHSRARGSARMVLMGIANHDGDGGAWPALSTLAKYAAITRENARKAVRKLEELGEVRVIVNGGGSLTSAYYERPNLYRVLLDCPPTCDRSRHHRVRDEVRLDLPSEAMGGGGIQNTAPPLALVPQGGIASEALTTHEPSIEEEEGDHSTREAPCAEVRSGRHKRDALGYCLHCGQLEQVLA